MSSPGLRRGLAAAAGVLLTIGVAVAVVVLASSGTPPHRSPAPVRVATTPPPPKPPPAPTDDPWPLYGYNLARTRFFPNGTKLHPPFKIGWRYRDHALLEFPPVIYDNTLYFEDADGRAKAVNTRN